MFYIGIFLNLLLLLMVLHSKVIHILFFFFTHEGCSLVMNTVMFPRVTALCGQFQEHLLFFALLLSLTALLGQRSPLPEVLLDIQKKSSLATLGLI